MEINDLIIWKLTFKKNFSNFPILDKKEGSEVYREVYSEVYREV
jgi:hypothetical protein